MMPKIEKQNSKPQTKQIAATGLLSGFSQVNLTDSGGVHIGLYGRTKTGKTRLISTAPKPVGILMGDIGGAKSIATIPGVEVIQVVLKVTGERQVAIKDVPQLVAELGSSKYATVALDTASSIQEIVLAHILGYSEIPVQNSWGMASIGQYGERSKMMKQIMAGLLGLPDRHVIITAHEMNFNDQSEGGSDLLDPSIGPALSKSTATWLTGQVDYICQTFIREKSVVENQDVNGKPVAIRRKVGGYEYCLRVGPDPIYMTGFRVVPGAVLPDVIVNPTFDKIMDVIQGVSSVRLINKFL